MRSHRDLLIFIAVDRMQVSKIFSVFIGCRTSGCCSVLASTCESSTVMTITEVFLLAPYRKINCQSPPQCNTNRQSIFRHLHNGIRAEKSEKYPKSSRNPSSQKFMEMTDLWRLVSASTGEASRWRVCYQRGLPRLVHSLINRLSHPFPRNLQNTVFSKP